MGGVTDHSEESTSSGGATTCALLTDTISMFS